MGVLPKRRNIRRGRRYVQKAYECLANAQPSLPGVVFAGLSNRRRSAAVLPADKIRVGTRLDMGGAYSDRYLYGTLFYGKISPLCSVRARAT